jgi:lipoprotein signal peptidase
MSKKWMALQLILLIGLDQITKAYFVSRDFFVPSSGFPLALVAGALVFFSWLYWRLRKRENKFLAWGFSLVFAGAGSNLLDRLVFGHVRDVLGFNLGFIFNLADVFIILGLFLILFQMRDNKV